MAKKSKKNNEEAAPSVDDPFDTGASGNGYDDEFEVDLAKQGKSAPAGTAIVQLTHLTKSVSQAGNPMWVFDFRIVEYRSVDGDVDTADWIGESLLVHCALTPNALWKLAETVRALGVDLPEDSSPLKFKLSDVVNVQCLAALKKGEFNGRPQTSIEALREHPDGGGTKGEPLDFMSDAAQDGDGDSIPF